MACLLSRSRAWAKELANDRHPQRSARHDPKRAIGQRLHTLGIEVFGEYAFEMVSNKINALGRFMAPVRRPCDSVPS
jgi:hypothetical protein